MAAVLAIAAPRIRASSSSLSGVKIAVKNGSGIQGCANEAASKLTPQGAVCETGNADDYNYKKTIVVYNGTDSSQAQKIADLLGVGTVKKNDGTYSFTGDYLVVVGQDWMVRTGNRILLASRT